MQTELVTVLRRLSRTSRLTVGDLMTVTLLFFLLWVCCSSITVGPLAGCRSSVLIVCRPQSPHSLRSAGFLLVNQVQKLPVGKIRPCSARGKQFSHHTTITGDGHGPNLCPSVPLYVFLFVCLFYTGGAVQALNTRMPLTQQTNEDSKSLLPNRFTFISSITSLPNHS